MSYQFATDTQAYSMICACAEVPVSMHETFCETLLRAYYELLVVIAIRAVAAVSVIRDKLGVLAGRIAIVVAYVT